MEVTLSEIAEQIPLGHECRSCGVSTYNTMKRCARYIEKGDICCPNFRHWIEQAKANKK
jgi:hypothetical protein